MINANPYITKLKNINLFSGLLAGEMSFRNGLNIISGENGTGKTKLLNLIKTGEREYINGNSNRIVIFNPKDSFTSEQQRQLTKFGQIIYTKTREALPIEKLLEMAKESDIVACDPDPLGGFDRSG